jgi:ABC-2 type transport system ATP-binding protein
MSQPTVKPLIEVRGLRKDFRYWSDRPTTFKSALVRLLQGKIRSGERRNFTALKDVSFEVKRGEFLGIMGKNGAGKSTLLKLITGIYFPTEGEIRVHATIAPLIELGAGFSPDLSGYENIFLNAAILGFGRAKTLDALPKIIDFSELGDKIHMPVKNYSSGMLVRLGFSIATQLDAPILLIDEVLAVGDAGFQAKCLRKIHELHQNGRTIVLITHDASAVELNCSRCIVIADQQKVFDGDAKEGADCYRRLFATPAASI